MYGMCRLFAWSAPKMLTLAESLGADQKNLVKLSELHRDGWGVAWQSADHGIRLIRDELPAFESGTFRNSATAVASRAAIVHLRWATEAIPVCIPNTHPFLKEGPTGEIAFAHNGGVPRGPELNALVDADLLDSIEGDTDSELYFAALISAARKSDGDLVTAFARTVRNLEPLNYSSINALALTGSHLYVLSQHRVECRPAGMDPDYYDLSWSDVDGTVTAWSSGVSDKEGIELPNGSLLKIETESGRHEVIDLASI